MEIWKDISGYEGLYQVSNLGNVKSMNWGGRGYSKNLYLKPHNKGYLQVELKKDGKRKMFVVHRLVAQAFIQNPNNFPIVNHKDENKTNNSAENLEWCDYKYNVRYSLLLRGIAPGEKKKPTRRNSKLAGFRVIQLDLFGNVIREWNNSREIFLTTGMSDWSISECCRGNRKKAYGFIWRYAS